MGKDDMKADAKSLASDVEGEANSAKRSGKSFFNEHEDEIKVHVPTDGAVTFLQLGSEHGTVHFV